MTVDRRLVLAFALVVGGCAMTPESVLIECPADIAAGALSYAHTYSSVETEYEFGGQDMLRALKLDCSGLVVNCYKYAVMDTAYRLPFGDAAVIDFYRKWTRPVGSPRPGDLIFMGDDENRPSHMAIFVKKESGNLYFIDSTSKPEEGLDGVSLRHYPETDGRFLSFGALLLETTR
jgi:cell wall-associated NlpC family hydrolase